MSNFIAKIADAAAPALLAFPVAIMLTTAAHAQTTTIRIADLDLASQSGHAAFEQRVDTAARQFCATERTLIGRQACKTGVRQEAEEKAAAVMAARGAAPVLAGR